MDVTGQNREPLPPSTSGRDVVHRVRERDRLARLLRSPALVLQLVAPFLGEVLSASTPPLEFILPWNLVLQSALYGSGALICRELMRRYRLGLLGLCLLGAAYAVAEEALIDRFWFDPQFQDDVGVGSYSRVWHTNLLLASHLTAFHIAVSICSSILLVERLFPGHRERPWAGRRGLTFAALALAVLVPLTYDDVARVPARPMLAAAGLCVLLFLCALITPRLPRRPTTEPRKSRPRLLGFAAFACTATHFVLVYALPSTGISWVVGIPIALTPIATGIFLIRRMRGSGGLYGPDGMRVVTGILSFFIVLDALVGLGGRYDLTAAAVAVAFTLRWLHTRDRRLSQKTRQAPPDAVSHQ